MTLLLINTLAQATVFETINGLKYSIDTLKNEASLVANSPRYSGDIVVPEKITFESKEYSVTSFGDRCFFDCYGLTSIDIPSSVTSLGNSCFSSCSKLTSIYILSSVTSLGDYCFANCSRLTSITIPSSVTSLGDGCFKGCSGLTSIEIPSSVTSVENSCFENCWELTTISIPSTVTSLGDRCFSDCSKLMSISCYTITPPKCVQETFDEYDPSLCKLYVPQESIDKYKFSDGWKSFPNIYAIEESGQSDQINSTSTGGIIATCNNGVITISGMNAQENVTFYSLSGKQLGTAVAVDGTVAYAVNTICSWSYSFMFRLKISLIQTGANSKSCSIVSVSGVSANSLASCFSFSSIKFFSPMQCNA